MKYEYVNDKGFQIQTSIHERIKIYNKERFDYVTKSELLYIKMEDQLEKN
ncbi:hypothetical protein H0I23_00575 [Cellulophaga sp. HaHaR_3_176]|nr:hypothetical protein H0I23_00575 [Cellulophaga sp. HaHaR_3_176]